MISPSDDPRWTAYVLAELEASERTRAEQDLATGAEAQEAVVELRQTAALLTRAFETLPALQLAAGDRDRITDAARRAVAPTDAFTYVVTAKEQPVWRRLAFAGMTAGVLGVAAAAVIAAQWPEPDRAGTLAMSGARFAGSAAQRVDAAPEMRLQVVTRVTNTPASFAVSPDGRTIAYVASPNAFASRLMTGESELMLRKLDDVSARSLAKGHLTELPVWSPDGRSLAFFADGKLKRLDIAGGAPIVLADAPRPRGGTWAPDGSILFAPTTDGPIMRIPAGGGAPTRATNLRPQQKGHGLPHFTSGNRFLFHASGDERMRGIYAGTLGSMETRRVLDADAAQLHLPSGHLLFVRNRTVFAQRFNMSRMEPAGDAHVLAEHVVIDGVSGAAALSASSTGPIVYRTWRSNSPESTDWTQVAISPDGRWIAYQANRSGQADIWVRPLRPEDRSTSAVSGPQQVSPDGGREPLWRADGRELFFVDRNGTTMSARVRTERNGVQVEPPAPLLPPGAGGDVGFSPDGRYIPFEHQPLVVLLNWAPRL
jgi:serine/threonine-protein kinase